MWSAVSHSPRSRRRGAPRSQIPSDRAESRRAARNGPAASSKRRRGGARREPAFDEASRARRPAPRTIVAQTAPDGPRESQKQFRQTGPDRRARAFSSRPCPVRERGSRRRRPATAHARTPAPSSSRPRRRSARPGARPPRCSSCPEEAGGSAASTPEEWPGAGAPWGKRSGPRGLAHSVPLVGRDRGNFYHRFAAPSSWNSSGAAAARLCERSCRRPSLFFACICAVSRRAPPSRRQFGAGRVFEWPAGVRRGRSRARASAQRPIALRSTSATRATRCPSSPG